MYTVGSEFILLPGIWESMIKHQQALRTIRTISVKKQQGSKTWSCSPCCTRPGVKDAAFRT